MSFVIDDCDSSQNYVISSVTPLLPCSSSLPFTPSSHLSFPLSHDHFLLSHLQYSLQQQLPGSLLCSITNLLFPFNYCLPHPFCFFLPYSLSPFLRVEAITCEVPGMAHSPLHSAAGIQEHGANFSSYPQTPASTNTPSSAHNS